MKIHSLLIILFLTACSSSPKIIAGKGAVYGVLFADANPAFKNKALSEKSAGAYGNKTTDVDYQDNMMNYPKLDDLYACLIDPKALPQEHHLIAHEKGMSQTSLALAVGDTLHIHNKTATAQNFFITAQSMSNQAFQAFPSLASGANARYTLKLEGDLELLSEENNRLKTVFFVRKNLRSQRVKSGAGYQFENLKAGDYSLIFWHWRLGEIQQNIQIQIEKNTRVDKVLSVDTVMHSH